MKNQIKAFDTVYFEIAGFCNAKCPYCISGSNKMSGNKPSFLKPEIFAASLKLLHDKHILTENATIYLYVWGEPFLHPQLPDLMKLANQYPYKIAFSTNASKVPVIDHNFVKRLQSITFSCSGFSQKSYDRIHGLDFEQIKANILKIVSACRQSGSKASFLINYHLYQFNLEELKLAQEFATHNKIAIKANYAILNNWELTRQWIDGTLPAEIMHRAACDLFNYKTEELLALAPADYKCPQYEYLVLDENANVCICCQTPKDDNFLCGNLLEGNIEEILQRRRTSAVCQDCIKSKMAFIFNNSLYSPEIVTNPPVPLLRKLIDGVLHKIKVCR